MEFLDNERFKYPHTPHFPWSRKVTHDDRVMSMTNLGWFRGRRVVVTEKLDGENTTMYPDHIHARSLDSRFHASRSWVKSFWGGIRADIPKGWRICGENMYAKHSIYYTELESYFYGFSIWNEHNVALPWDETVEWFNLLGIVPVPVLYDGIYDEKIIKWLWKESDRDKIEGNVMRDADAIRFEDFERRFAKFVRKGHVQTDEHWMHAEIVPNLLRVQNVEHSSGQPTDQVPSV